MDSLTLVQEAAIAALGKKALDIVAQDVRSASDICQFQLVCSGNNERQNIAICDGIEDHLKGGFGVRPVAIEGKKTGQWIVIDFGPTIIHIFSHEVRGYYALDSLWPDAITVDVGEALP